MAGQWKLSVEVHEKPKNEYVMSTILRAGSFDALKAKLKEFIAGQHRLDRTVSWSDAEDPSGKKHDMPKP